MKITFILKDLSEVFYNGNSGSITGLLTMPDADKFEYLKKRAAEGSLGITSKIGHADSFRDRVEFNQMLRQPCSYGFKIEPRRGYKLVTFEIEKL